MTAPHDFLDCARPIDGHYGCLCRAFGDAKGTCSPVINQGLPSEILFPVSSIFEAVQVLTGYIISRTEGLDTQHIESKLCHVG